MPWANRRLRNSVQYIIVLSLCMILSSCGFLSWPHRGQKINERWEATNGTFRIRVTAYAEEGGGFVAGAYYVFEHASMASQDWREIVTIRLDDPNPIPREQVRFLDDNVGYFFLQYSYVVTTDGGLSWSVWDAVQEMPDWMNHRALILEVEVLSDGSGTMHLRSIDPAGLRQLKTTNYGVTWH